jgi:hypothetical protein
VKIGLALSAIQDAETELADEFAKVGDRHRVEHDVFHLSRTFEQMCRRHVEKLAPFAERYGTDSADSNGAGEGVLSGLRRKASELLGRQPPAGILLLRDLRGLYVLASEVSIDWVMLAQAAQAARDGELLSVVSECHDETLRQVRWATTKIKNSAPQALTS